MSCWKKKKHAFNIGIKTVTYTFVKSYQRYWRKLSKVLGLYTFPFKISLNIAVIKVFLYLTEKMHHYYILVSYYLKHFNDNNNCWYWFILSDMFWGVFCKGIGETEIKHIAFYGSPHHLFWPLKIYNLEPNTKTKYVRTN